jgi:hypothetical protein
MSKSGRKKEDIRFKVLKVETLILLMAPQGENIDIIMVSMQ